MTEKEIGKITQIIGPVIDIRFTAGHLPAMLNALTIDFEDERTQIVLEVAQHLGENTVRAVAMQSTDGLVRGMPVADTGRPISVPVGPGTLGRIMNVVGKPVDEAGPIESKRLNPIHRPAPSFDEQETTTEMLETGIKVIDLL
ncbi:MAG: F0F1 ATP synthase subunit beta, partial [Nitrospinota bacterium]